MIPLGTYPDQRASELLETAPPRFSTLAEMTIEETFTMSPTNALYRLSGFGPLAEAERDTASPMLTQEQANEKYGVADLRFDGPVNERTAQLLWTEKRAEMLRKEALARGPDGFWNATNWGLFGVGLATSAVDPVSLAAGVLTSGVFTAFRGGHAALSAARAVGQQSFVRAAALGAAEGAIGAALVEPLVYAMADDYSIDYGPSDSLMNIAAGAAGGALFAGLGVAIDRFRRPSMQASDTALSMAVAQVEAGKPVRVEPILRRDIEPLDARRADKPPDARATETVVREQAVDRSFDDLRTEDLEMRRVLDPADDAAIPDEVRERGAPVAIETVFDTPEQAAAGADEVIQMVRDAIGAQRQDAVGEVRQGGVTIEELDAVIASADRAIAEADSIARAYNAAANCGI